MRVRGQRGLLSRGENWLAVATRVYHLFVLTPRKKVNGLVRSGTRIQCAGARHALKREETTAGRKGNQGQKSKI
jgi:hypothetical protein